MAYFNLGLMYEDTEDYQESLKWYTLAAEKYRWTEAQNKLGNMYFNGKGVKKDYHQAVKWYTLAAEQGNVEEQNNLAEAYLLGLGIPENKERALYWYRKSRDKGNQVGHDNYCQLKGSWGSRVKAILKRLIGSEN